MSERYHDYASHIPKEYNGLQGYWNDGAQVLGPHDRNIIAGSEPHYFGHDIRFKGNKKLIEIMAKTWIKALSNEVASWYSRPKPSNASTILKLVYTPIHGTGITLVPDAFESIGFTSIIHVPEQDVISGDFPTVLSSNPEDRQH